MGLGDWLDDAADFGSDLFDLASDKVGSAWDWATGSEAAMGAAAGVGKGVLSYMSNKNAPDAGEDYAERVAAHNAGITKAAKKYTGG